MEITTSPGYARRTVIVFVSRGGFCASPRRSYSCSFPFFAHVDKIQAISIPLSPPPPLNFFKVLSVPFTKMSVLAIRTRLQPMEKIRHESEIRRDVSPTVHVINSSWCKTDVWMNVYPLFMSFLGQGQG